MVYVQFHPNVYASGDLCLDILQNRWSPTYDVAAILTSYDPLHIPVYLSFSVFSVPVPLQLFPSPYPSYICCITLPYSLPEFDVLDRPELIF